MGSACSSDTVRPLQRDPSVLLVGDEMPAAIKAAPASEVKLGANAAAPAPASSSYPPHQLAERGFVSGPDVISMMPTRSPNPPLIFLPGEESTWASKGTTERRAPVAPVAPSAAVEETEDELIQQAFSLLSSSNNNTPPSLGAGGLSNRALPPSQQQARGLRADQYQWGEQSMSEAELNRFMAEFDQQQIPGAVGGSEKREQRCAEEADDDEGPSFDEDE
jgi:hypothetical protein